MARAESPTPKQKYLGKVLRATPSRTVWEKKKRPSLNTEGLKVLNSTVRVKQYEEEKTKSQHYGF